MAKPLDNGIVAATFTGRRSVAWASVLTNNIE